MAKRSIVVFDCETTGLYPQYNHRIVEFGIVRITEDGTVEDEFTSLVNPQRDIGPSSIHGLLSEDILDAPTFADLSGEIADRMSGGAMYAAHNVMFDVDFLRAEYSRLGYRIPFLPLTCTMRVSGGGNLASCCDKLGVDGPDECHSALDDARAAAGILAQALRRRWVDIESDPIDWPALEKTRCTPVSRKEKRARPKTNPYLHRLVELSNDLGTTPISDGLSLAYLSLLDRVLEDRRIDPSEGESLVETAIHWGLSRPQIENLHDSFLRQLSFAALLDGVVTVAEREDLHQVATLLGRSPGSVDQAIHAAGQHLAESGQPVRGRSEEFSGLSVCFTGELRGRIAGEPIAREQASCFARQAGLTVAASVTKKLDLLIVADPNTQSGKAKKARSYGTRIIAENVFWKAIGIEVD